METLEIENNSNRSSRFRSGWNLGLKIILGFGCVGVILGRNSFLGIYNYVFLFSFLDWTVNRFL